MGLQKHKKNYLFIADDIIELQMFQGCQNWSWISQGVLGSNFIALPGIFYFFLHAFQRFLSPGANYAWVKIRHTFY